MCNVGLLLFIACLLKPLICLIKNWKVLLPIIGCMQDTFARARTRLSARATIGYLVYNIIGYINDK